MKIFTFLTLIFSLFFNTAYSTDPVFSGDPIRYPEELKTFMQNTAEQHEDKLNQFLKAWQEDSIFSDIEQLNIILLSQKLEAKNGRPYPHFINLMECMLLFKHKSLSSQNYTNWLEGMEYHLDAKKTNTLLLNQLLEFTVALLSENAIAKSSSTTWKSVSGEFKFVSDEGLFVDINQTDLVCYIRTDSLNLFNTNGRVDPANNEWKGSGGLVTWERAGYSRDQVFATLTSYVINLDKSEYAAKEVVFTNKVYLDKSIKGDLEDKVKHIKEPDDANYPQFFSYTKTFKINDLYKDVNYEGGLSMQGAKLVGTGTMESPAHLFLFRKDTLVLEATSLYFGFKIDRIASERTSIVIKLRHDSIFHSDLLFTYRVENRELTLLKTENYSSLAPYSNSYHKVDMNFDQLSWRLDEDYMRFSAPKGTSIGNAYFESVNYFNYDKFLNLQLMDKAHPLLSLRTFSRKYGSEVFPVTAYADYLKMPLTDVKHMVMRMAFNGFVFYDNNTELVTIKPRLHEYIAASVNKIDYDVIGFPSSVEAPSENAIFNLRNYDLTINGIPQIFVSDSQNVIIYPKSDKIILKQNRNFQFDGTVVAGLMTFYGKNLFFSYDSFKVNLQNVDSVNIGFLTGQLDNFGFPKVGRVKNMLENVTGEVLIDQPDNKSGRISHAQYPIFRSKETSFVYYDSKAIQNGAYNSNDFYFAVTPFEMDSLDNFSANSMKFSGEFVSAGIFPPFPKDLSLQADYSLGFNHQSPTEGMPVYGGKGIFTNEIKLSNTGLRGKGTVNYLTSTTWSDDFIFYPDSMNTNSQRFEITEQTTLTEYPMVKSIENYVHWEPYNDSMRIVKTTTDFTMFNDTTKLSGELVLKPSGLSGSGRMDLTNSELQSDLYTYKSKEIFSDTSDFYLKSLRDEGFTVLTDNINSHIDYTQQKGWFKSNEGYSLVTFPENKYISYIDFFTWDMRKKTLAMGSKLTPELPDYTIEDVEPEGPRYISTEKSQDSLSFVSPLAYYDYQNNYINATGVKFIEIADARIYPFEGLLTVQPNYKVKTLENARSVANKTTKYHTLHTATLNIESRNTYNGMANCNYIDENGDKQIIHFKNVEVDSGGQTIAKAEIFESNEFTLSPVYKYQGKAFLFANDSLLTFNGSTRIEHNCDKLEPEWLYFESPIYPNDIYIPIQRESKNIDRQKIFNGMFVYYDSVHIYPTFLDKRKNYSDRQIITPEGYLYYDRAQQLFKVGSKEKINNFMLAENYVSLHREDCKLYGEGEIDLGENLGQLKLKPYGSVSHDINENKTEFDLLMGINFYMDPEMLNLMGTEIDSFPDLEAVNLTRPINKKAMTAWVGAYEAQKLQDELNLFGTIKFLPQELKYSILLNEIHLVWDNTTNSYHSVGKIGVASINGIQINKLVDGFFELRIKRSGDMMDLYLQLDRRNYYYFGYTRGVMQTLSSNRQYVETIMGMKPGERTSKTPGSETPYSFLISTDRKKNNFYRRWQDIVSGNEAREEE